MSKKASLGKTIPSSSPACCQVDKIEMLSDKRRKAGHEITAKSQGMKGIAQVFESAECKHVFCLYAIYIEERELASSRDEFMKVILLNKKTI